MTSFDHIGRSLLMHWAAVAVLTGGPVNAAPVSIETIGAEKCGGRVTAYEVEFLAPDSAALEATPKSVCRWTDEPYPRRGNIRVR